MTLDESLEFPIADGFRVIKKVGAGKQRMVYLVEHDFFGEGVYKSISSENGDLINEAKSLYALAKLTDSEKKNPNVVSLLHVNVERKPYYILEEYVKGQNLREIYDENLEKKLKKLVSELSKSKNDKKFLLTEITSLQELKKNSNLMTEDRFLSFFILREIANGLAFIHSKKVVHNDLKLENIVKSAGKVKIVDFGISNESRTNILHGAPEVLAGIVPDFRSDVYMLCSLAYQIFTGKPPFYTKDWNNLSQSEINGLKKELLKMKIEGLDKESVKQLQKSAENSLAEIILAGLSPYPSNRPKNGIILSRKLKWLHYKETISDILLQIALVAAISSTPYILRKIFPHQEFKSLVSIVNDNGEFDVHIHNYVDEKLEVIDDLGGNDMYPQFARDGFLFHSNGAIIFRGRDYIKLLTSSIHNQYFRVSPSGTRFAHTKYNTETKKTALFVSDLDELHSAKNRREIHEDIKQISNYNFYDDEHIVFSTEQGLIIKNIDGKEITLFPKLPMENGAKILSTNTDLDYFTYLKIGANIFYRVGDLKTNNVFELDEDGNLIEFPKENSYQLDDLMRDFDSWKKISNIGFWPFKPIPR